MRGKGKDIKGRDLLTCSMDELEEHLRDDLAITRDLADRTMAVWGSEVRDTLYKVKL